MNNNHNTYKKSGVNMASANKLVNYITKISRKTYNKNTELKSFKNIGSFGSIFDISTLKMKEPIIVSSTDGIGTKGIVESHALVTDTINVGRLVHLAAVATDGRSCVIVRDN